MTHSTEVLICTCCGNDITEWVKARFGGALPLLFNVMVECRSCGCSLIACGSVEEGLSVQEC